MKVGTMNIARSFHSSTQPSLHYPKDWLFYEEHNYPTKIYCLRVDIQGLLGMMSTWDLVKNPTNGWKLEQWKWQEVHIHLFFWTDVCIPVEVLTHQIMKLPITKSWIWMGESRRKRSCQSNLNFTQPINWMKTNTWLLVDLKMRAWIGREQM